MLKNTFSPWPSFSENEANAVKKIILSNKVNYWTGDECRIFEKEFLYHPFLSLKSIIGRF